MNMSLSFALCTVTEREREREREREAVSFHKTLRLGLGGLAETSRQAVSFHKTQLGQFGTATFVQLGRLGSRDVWPKRPGMFLKNRPLPAMLRWPKSITVLASVTLYNYF